MRATFEKQDQFLLRGRRQIGFRSWPPMFHHHAEMVYVVKGSIKTNVDGKTHTLVPGELSVIFPYVTHSYEASAEAEALVLMISPEASAFDSILRTKQPLGHCMDAKAYAFMLSRAVELIRGGKIKTAQGYVNAVLGEFLEQVTLKEADESSRDTAVKILDYCTAHFTENITSRQVAQALYVSQSHISKLFARKFKYSFREYINQLRIDKAKTLLEDPEKKILDVMYESGFQNQSSFNRVFKELCGLSPRQYKDRLK